MTKVAKFHPKFIKTFMPSLMIEIKTCEQKRGSGVDMKLRDLYDHLQMDLNKIT